MQWLEFQGSVVWSGLFCCVGKEVEVFVANGACDKRVSEAFLLL